MFGCAQAATRLTQEMRTARRSHHLGWTRGFEHANVGVPAVSHHGASLHRLSAHDLQRFLIKSAAIPSEGFSITKGEPVVGGLHGTFRHFFRPHCMSWVFTRPDGFDFVNIRATMLDDPSGFAPFIETYTSEKLSWAKTPALHSFEGFPAIDGYNGVTKRYSDWLGRSTVYVWLPYVDLSNTSADRSCDCRLSAVRRQESNEHLSMITSFIILNHCDRDELNLLFGVLSVGCVAYKLCH
jgi:hypothetical protein